MLTCYIIVLNIFFLLIFYVVKPAHTHNSEQTNVLQKSNSYFQPERHLQGLKFDSNLNIKNYAWVLAIIIKMVSCSASPGKPFCSLFCFVVYLLCSNDMFKFFHQISLIFPFLISKLFLPNDLPLTHVSQQQNKQHHHLKNVLLSGRQQLSLQRAKVLNLKCITFNLI